MKYLALEAVFSSTKVHYVARVTGVHWCSQQIAEISDITIDPQYITYGSNLQFGRGVDKADLNGSVYMELIGSTVDYQDFYW